MNDKSVEKDWKSVSEQEPEDEVSTQEKPKKDYGNLTHAQLIEKILELEEQCEGLVEKEQELEDKFIRAQAESQNVLQRAEREKDKARKFAIESFASELIDVVDNIERGLEAFQADNAEIESAKEGMELTHKIFLDTLGKHGIEQINPEGEKFNPDQHEAMSMHEDKKVKPGNVITVFQKGYLLNDRVIRPAMVVVSK